MNDQMRNKGSRVKDPAEIVRHWFANFESPWVRSTESDEGRESEAERLVGAR